MRHPVVNAASRVLSVAALVTAASSQAAPITAFAFVKLDVSAVNYGLSGGFGTPIRAEISRSRSQVSPYRTTDFEAAASADLAAGTLKARSVQTVRAGQESWPSGPGQRATHVQAVATLGDSFRTYSGSNPFNWTGEVARFTFDLSGLRSETGLNFSSNWGSPGESMDNVSASLLFYVLQPGALDLVFQKESWPKYHDPAGYMELGREIAAKRTNSVLAHITEECCGQGLSVSVPRLPGSFEFAFEPGGDFDWVAQLAVITMIDMNTPAASAAMDLMHTASIGYQAPSGATTYSASGVFPGTLSLDRLNAVPAPTSTALVVAGLLALLSSAGRRRPPNI